MKTVILVTHGNLGEELIKTTELITGNIKNLSTVSNNGLSLQGLINKLEEKIHSFPDKSIIIIMVEMIGGSPYIAGRKTAKKFKNVYFLSGVNIPMLISFCTKSDHLEINELVELLKKDALRGIELIKPDNI